MSKKFFMVLGLCVLLAGCCGDDPKDAPVTEAEVIDLSGVQYGACFESKREFTFSKVTARYTTVVTPMVEYDYANIEDGLVVGKTHTVSDFLALYEKVDCKEYTKILDKIRINKLDSQVTNLLERVEKLEKKR